MSVHETELQRRQRMAETAAHGPIITGSTWELEQGTPLWSEASSNPDVARMLGLAVELLPHPQAAIVEMRIWGRLTFSEIADELDLPSRGYAHVYYTRGLAKLREGFENAI